MSHKTYPKNQNGIIALLMVVVVMFASLTSALSIVFVFLNQVKETRNIAYSYESIYATESGVEDILLRYFDTTKTLPTYPSILSVGDASASTTLSEDFFGNGTITTEGDRVGRNRRVEVRMSITGPGAFNLAIQIGDGGLIMESNSIVIGDVYSNGDITGSTNSEIQGDAIAVGTISSPDPDVTGTKTEGAESQPLPAVDVDYWKSQANINGDPLIGDQEFSDSNTLGPRKIEGSLTIKSNGDITLTGPIHVTGDFTMESRTNLFLDESFAASTTVVIVDGLIEFNSNSQVYSTTATPKGYILMLSTSTSTTAIEINSLNPIDCALYAPNGTLFIGSRAKMTSIAGYQIHLASNAEIEYDFGLHRSDFTGGPSSGAKITSWQEQ